MSRASKGINTEKIYNELQKADLDEQIAFFEELKHHLNGELDKRVEGLDGQKKKYLHEKEKINQTVK